jgi:hypothetical protein
VSDPGRSPPWAVASTFWRSDGRSLRSRSCLLPLAQANTRTAPILFDEHHACAFQRSADRALIRGGERGLPLRELRPPDGVDAQSRCPGEIGNTPFEQGAPGSDLGTVEHWLPRFVQMDLFSEDVCWRRKARKKGHFDTPRGERYAGLLQRILHRCDGFLRYNPSFALKIDHRRQPKPSHSYAELTDVLIAAYCPAVANMVNLSVSERWRRMRQFDTILQQQLAANMMPPGSLVIANVPLPPAVYRTLRAQAAASGQTPAQLMAAILSRAAGN